MDRVFRLHIIFYKITTTDKFKVLFYFNILKSISILAATDNLYADLIDKTRVLDTTNKTIRMSPVACNYTSTSLSTSIVYEIVGQHAMVVLKKINKLRYFLFSRETFRNN